MKLILSMEELDGRKKKSRTIHTQTDFGPYSAFPSQSADTPPSAPSTPSVSNGKISSPFREKKDDIYGTRDATILKTTETNHLRNATDTVDGRKPEINGIKELNGFSNKRISFHSEEFTLLRSSVLGKTLWDRENNSFTSHTSENQL